jgi:hypothetical protein
MKFAKLLLVMLLLFIGIVASYAPARANAITGLGFKEDFISDGNCRTDIMALTPQSSGDRQSILQRPNSDVVIDYYGPCGETPLREDHPNTRRLDSDSWDNGE